MGWKQSIKRILPKPILRLAQFVNAVRRAEGRRRATEGLIEKTTWPASTGKPRLVFQTEFFDKGGLEEVVLALVRQFLISGEYDLAVIVSHGPPGQITAACQALGVPVFHVEGNEFYHHAVVRKLKPAIAHLHYSVFCVGEFLIRKAPVIYSIHNNYAWADAAFVKARRRLYRRFTTLVASSRQTRTFFCEKFSLPESSVQVISNGLSISEEVTPANVQRADYGLDAGDFVFVNVANLNWHKAHLLTIAAFKILKARYPEIRLVLVGGAVDAEYAVAVRQAVLDPALQGSVQVVDFLPRAELCGLLRLCDCYVMPSVVEGWSMAIMEAMRAELPLILTDVGSAREVIEDEDVGIVIPNASAGDYAELEACYCNGGPFDNLNALCEAMTRVLEDRALWREKGKFAREKMETRFTSTVMADRYRAVYAKALADAKAKR